MYVVFATIATFVPSCVNSCPGTYTDSRSIRPEFAHPAVFAGRSLRLTSTITSKSPLSGVALFR